jgi:hypothetical protein
MLRHDEEVVKNVLQELDPKNCEVQQACNATPWKMG